MSVLAEFFEMPAMLLHLVLVAGAAGLLIVAARKRRRLLAAWPGILKQSDRQRQFAWRFSALRVVGLSCLVIAIAGPRGGEEKTPTIAGRRDVMIVLDVSRSMAAEQPSRLDKAVRSLRTLTEAKRLPAGTRVGLVVFAARPWLAFPLTADFEHLAMTLDQIAAGEIPREVRGNTNTHISGTRLGAAVKLAIDGFPPSNSARNEIVLLSDGDDPEDDQEWLQGLTAARTRGVPVNVVAIGEPGVAATIPYRGDVLQFEGTIVKTEVQRARLDEIAQRTGGLSSTIERGELPLANLLTKRWAELPAPVESRDSRATANVRSAWRFPWLLAAMIAFLVVELGLAWPTWLSVKRFRRGLAGFACLALVAAEAESAGQSALRRGQDAFARRDFAVALRFFDEAQPLLADPSLVAFNRGAAHYRLGQFSEASRAYRQALDDAAIPTERRDRARFDLGNSLLGQAGAKDRRLLEGAIAAYKQCLTGNPSDILKRDAEYNLAIAGRRLLALKPSETPPENDPNPKTNGEPKSEDPKNSKQSAVSSAKDPPSKSGPNETQPPEGTDASQKSPALAPITVLPDESNPIAMTPAQAAATLAAQVERIALERRRDRQTRDIVSPHGKDW